MVNAQIGAHRQPVSVAQRSSCRVVPKSAGLSSAGVLTVSNADRVVFPAVGRTKGDVVAYYARVAERALVHVVDRPMSIRRYPKGLAAPGFFQKNMPAHYPASFGRLEVARSDAATKRHAKKGSAERDVTVYPIVREAEHLAYLANQGAIELHVPTARASDPLSPDRLVLDLDPPEGEVALVRRAALLAREALARHGLESAPMATGSKGYHVVAALDGAAQGQVVASATQKLAALLAAEHPAELTITFRVARRGERVFVDWLRNNPFATVVAPYSLRARPRATVATPLAWSELDRVAPDLFSIDDVDLLLERPDTLAELSARPGDGLAFVASVDAAFERSGLVLETFDRFRG